MPILRFQVAPEMAKGANECAEFMGVTPSELFREALRRHINPILAERDAEIYERMPLTEEELSSFEGVEYWLPTEDWSDWEVDDDAASPIRRS